MRVRSLSTIVLVGLLMAESCSVALALGQSAVACDSYARDYASQASKRGQVLGGGAKGSLLGAGFGAIAGSAGAGAAIGAAVGIIGGGAHRRQDAERIYQAAYQDCMAGRR